MTTLRAHVARSSAWSLLGQGLQLAFGIVSFWALSHWVGPSDYGLVGMASAVTGILAVVADAGIVAAVVRAETVNDAVEATAFWVSLVGAFAFALLGVLVAPLLGWYFHDASVTWLSVVLSAAFPLAAAGRVPTALLTRDFRFRELTAIALGANVGAALVAIGLAYAGAGPWAVVAQTLLAFALQSIALCFVRRFAISIRLVTRSQARTLVAFSWRMSGFALCTVAAQAGQPLLGGRLIGPDAPGLVGMAVRLLTNPVQRVVAALSSVLLPALLRLDPRERSRPFARAVRVALLVTAPASIVTAVLAPELAAWLPPRWAGMAETIRAVAVGLAIEPVGWFSIAVLTAQGRAPALLRFGTVFVCIGWVGSFVGAVAGSAAALAWGGSCANLLGGAILLGMVWRSLGLGRAFWDAVRSPFIASALAGAAARLAISFSHTGASRMGFAIGVASALVAYFIYLAVVLSADVRWILEAMRARGPGGDTMSNPVP